ncbi:hypothetical protein K3495_g1407 [Podosphaera aphanis]|nr:hypothetical protein K3495_g1407 [Podosphaera aphanis]
MEQESIDTMKECACVARYIFSSSPNDRKLKDFIVKAFYTVFTEQSDTDEEYALPAKAINGIPIPRTYRKAINDKTHGPQWKKAIKEEINALV